jgi:hypothetical protein
LVQWQWNGKLSNVDSLDYGQEVKLSS